MQFPELERITFNPLIMGGKPCIRGMRITVGTIVGLVASGASFEEILQLYPYLESEDIGPQWHTLPGGPRSAKRPCRPREDSAGHESFTQLDSLLRIRRSLRRSLEFHWFPFGLRH